MGDSNPPTMDLANLRIDDLVAEGGSATVWNASITKGDSEGNVTIEAYILKTFKSNEAFIKEAAVYERITETSALQTRVPRYYGIVPPHSILLGKLDGEILEDCIWDISKERRQWIKWKVIEALQMLGGHGISHGKITSKNIIVPESGFVKLVNFSHATLKEDLEQEDMWRTCMVMENMEVEEIFDEVESAKAYEEATVLLECLRDGKATAAPQERLASLLDEMECPEEGILNSIMVFFKNPTPILALPLAKCLTSHYHRYTEAIEILLESGKCSNTPFLLVAQDNKEKAMQMKENVARYQATIEVGSRDDAMPPSNDYFEDAVSFHLHSTPEAHAADETVMNLRLELAKHLHGCYLRHVGHAMDVCVRALDEAKCSGGEVLLGHLKDYSKLIEAAKEHLALDIHDIRKHMWEGKEHGWARWARLPMLEQAFHRATEARRLCNHLWADRQVEGDPGTIWALPVDWMLEDYA